MIFLVGKYFIGIGIIVSEEIAENSITLQILRSNSIFKPIRRVSSVIIGRVFVFSLQ